MDRDLFGNEIAPPGVPQPKGRRKPTRPQGHAWTPGTGPPSETCGTCAHLVRRHLAKSYLKCSLVRTQWTGGPGTDVRARDPACLKWKSK